MKYVQMIKGKEATFTFANKKAERDYVDISQTIWGCVPCDVNWATGTDIYNKQLTKIGGQEP